MKKHCYLFPTLLVASLLSSGCASYRGFPSNGGGKRFDEEQRVVSASIRDAAKHMDLSGLLGKKVVVVITGLEQSGVARRYVTSGLQELDLRVRGSYNDVDNERRQPPLRTPPGPPLPNGSGNAANNAFADRFGNSNYDRLEQDQIFLGDASGTYVLSPTLAQENLSTRDDMNYFAFAIEMFLRHAGIQIVTEESNADVVLNIMLSVLGTNYSRTDYLVAYNDELAASCEFLYYLSDPTSQAIVQTSKIASSRARYYDNSIRFSPFYHKNREVDSLDESIIPVPGESFPNERSRKKRGIRKTGSKKTRSGEQLSASHDAIEPPRKGASTSTNVVANFRPYRQSAPTILDLQ